MAGPKCLQQSKLGGTERMGLIAAAKPGTVEHPTSRSAVRSATSQIEAITDGVPAYRKAPSQSINTVSANLALPGAALKNTRSE